jgi:crotonobetainyl-CoA:carnitine CoA-transferase CaiB-like acyl-CoA transferase
MLNRALPAALTGVRVLELGAGLPVEMIGQLLVGLGATVTKLERPGAERLSSPATFAAINRAKDIRAVDLKSAPGAAEWHRLLRTHGVVVQGYSEAAATRLGVDFETVLSIRPDVVYCEVVGYSALDPGRGRTGHDPTYLAAAGLLPVDVVPDGWSGLPFALADQLGAVYAALALLAVLARRRAGAEPDRGAAGERIQVSLFDAAMTAASSRLNDVLADPGFDLAQTRGGLGLFRTADRVEIVIAAFETRFFEGLDDALDLPRFVGPDALAAPRRFGRTVNEGIAAAVAAVSYPELAELLDARRIPYARALPLTDGIRSDLARNASAYGSTASGEIFHHHPVLTEIRSGHD